MNKVILIKGNFIIHGNLALAAGGNVKAAVSDAQIAEAADRLVQTIEGDAEVHGDLAVYGDLYVTGSLAIKGVPR